MYRLLVVDDEPEIASSIYELLQTDYNDHELELYKCYSGGDALGLLANIKMDLVITDINMPGFSGFDLVEHINQNWKYCQVIFLTGYGSEEYLRTAIHYNNVQFVLKNEPDDVLLAAVSWAIGEIVRGLESGVIEEGLKRILAENLPIMRQDFIRQLLKGGAPPEQLHVKGKQLGILLEPQEDCLLFLAVTRGSFESGTPYCLKSLAQRLFPENAPLCLEQISPETCACILPLRDPVKIAMVRGMAEEIQTQLKKVFNISASFVFCGEPFPLSSISEVYRAMLGLYFSSPAGLEGEFLCYRPEPNPRNLAPQLDTLSADELEIFLEQCDFPAVCAFLDQVRACLDLKPDTLKTAQILSELSLRYLKFINQYRLYDLAPENAAFQTLCHPDPDPLHRLLFLRDFTEELFRLKKSSSDTLGRDVYRSLTDYIENNLEQDLTLTALSERIHFNPSYISRQFKALYGINLIDFITMRRLDKAKKLLLETDLKIGEIAVHVGYDTTTYFNRVFKKHVGTTPMQFRGRI